jgi:hypothetical protein
MHDLCFYYNQLSSLTFVEVRDIPPSTFSPQARYFEAANDFLSPGIVPEEWLRNFYPIIFTNLIRTNLTIPRHKPNLLRRGYLISKEDYYKDPVPL